MGKGQRFQREYLQVIPEFDPGTQAICRVVEIRGKGIVQLAQADGSTVLAVLPPKFRSVLWLRRGTSRHGRA